MLNGLRRSRKAERFLYDENLVPRTKALRKAATPQENRLWYCFLRAYPVRFQRQKPIDQYIVDFYCHDAQLVIELDGSQHYEPEGQLYDAFRTTSLEKKGILVLRYSNNEINQYFTEVCEQIDFTVKQRISAHRRND